MGAVWLAEHVMLGRQVAIKVLHRETSQKPDIIARFFNEAKAATAISDPGIVQIFDFGHHSDGNAYIVMELLRPVDTLDVISFTTEPRFFVEDRLMDDAGKAYAVSQISTISSV